ncbi:hypothetical protein D3C85_1306180 [compost metagenome]
MSCTNRCSSCRAAQFNRHRICRNGNDFVSFAIRKGKSAGADTGTCYFSVLILCRPADGCRSVAANSPVNPYIIAGSCVNFHSAWPGFAVIQASSLDEDIGIICRIRTIRDGQFNMIDYASIYFNGNRHNDGQTVHFRIYFVSPS